MWTPYDTINASLFLLDDPPYDAVIVASLLDDLRIYRDERQEIYQRAILAEHKLYFSEAEIVRLQALVARLREQVAQLEAERAEIEAAECSCCNRPANRRLDAVLCDWCYEERVA